MEPECRGLKQNGSLKHIPVAPPTSLHTAPQMPKSICINTHRMRVKQRL